jgi:cytoskeleton protein RodZ
MPTIGDSLREARMREHLDIADVEARTKIRAKYLRALENEEFGMLPGPTFVKTFLRTYAEALGLDPQALVEEYRATYEPREEMEQLQPLGPTAVARDRRRVGPPRGPWVAIAVAVVAVIAVLAVIGLVSGGGDDSGKRSGSTTEANKPKQKPKKQKEKATPAPQTVALRIVPANQIYVCLDTGAGSPIKFEGILDGPRTFRAGRLLRVNLGKTDVQLTKNGKPVSVPPGPEPVGFTFTPTTTKPLALGDRPCA